MRQAELAQSRKGAGTSGTIVDSGKPVAGKVKVIGYLIVNGQELLNLSRRIESLRDPLASPCGRCEFSARFFRSHGEVESDRRSGKVKLQPPTLETTKQVISNRRETSNAIRNDLGAIFMELSAQPG